GQILPGLAAAHARRAFRDDVRALPGVFVADLDQDPAMLAGPGQGEAAREFAARHDEGHMLWLRAHDLRRALIPDDHSGATGPRERPRSHPPRWSGPRPAPPAAGPRDRGTAPWAPPTSGARRRSGAAGRSAMWSRHAVARRTATPSARSSMRRTGRPGRRSGDPGRPGPLA